MQSKVNIRKIELKDYEYIDKWWIEQGYDAISKEILPMQGLGGLIVEKEKPIAAAYLYLTNSKMGYIEHLISNPDYKGKGFWHYPLMKACVSAAKNSGCKEVWGTSCVNSVVKRLNRYGCDISKESHHIIWYKK